VRPVFIPSTSALHDILPGGPLPDTLTGVLTATPFEYTITAASVTPQGDKFDEASVRREADLLKICNSQRREENNEDTTRRENESSSDDRGLPDSCGHEFYAK
jgi:hypothetical protein